MTREDRKTAMGMSIAKRALTSLFLVMALLAAGAVGACSGACPGGYADPNWCYKKAGGGGN